MKLLGYLRLIPPLLGLLTRLSWLALGTAVEKRRALRAFRRTLRHAGLPEPFISKLAADYNLSFSKLLRGRLSLPKREAKRVSLLKARRDK